MSSDPVVTDTGRGAYLEIISGHNRTLPGRLSRAVLGGLSIGYRVGLFLNNRWAALTATRLPCKVVSVGNLTVGGTGKTPMVEWIARRLTDAGRSVAIVSRGYGAVADSGMNDEGKLLAENLDAVPHIQDKSRVAAGKAVIKNYNPDVIVLDDAFQHRNLARDLDIVMIDATEPFGYDHLLPRGLLRENPKALRRADMVVISRCDQVPGEVVEQVQIQIRKYAPEVTISESVHHPVDLYNLSDKEHLKLDWFAWNKAAAFCGIASPQGFHGTLKALGCEPVLYETFPDHNHYSREQVEAFIARAAKAGAEAVVTTQKDAVKLADCTDLKLPILQLKIELRLRSGAQILKEWLHTLTTGANADHGNLSQADSTQHRDVG